MNSGRIKLNVGGTVFETSTLTLTRVEGTVLKTILEERWSGPACSHDQEIFIDRDPTHFRIILNFLRDGAFTPPSSERHLAEIEREAEFYGINELVEECRTNREPIVVDDKVTWREEVVALYWKTFVRFWVDDSLILPFVYERNNHTFARCIACTEVQDPKCSYNFEYNDDIWAAMSDQMKHMTANVTQLVGKTCCVLKWSNGRSMHLPLMAIRKVKNTKT